MTLASKITLVRVAMIPVFLVFMYLSGGVSGLWLWLSLGFLVARLARIRERPAEKMKNSSKISRFFARWASSMEAGSWMA